jgi:hypothetical protein
MSTEQKYELEPSTLLNDDRLGSNEHSPESAATLTQNSALEYADDQHPNQLDASGKSSSDAAVTARAQLEHDDDSGMRGIQPKSPPGQVEIVEDRVDLMASGDTSGQQVNSKNSNDLHIEIDLGTIDTSLEVHEHSDDQHWDVSDSLEVAEPIGQQQLEELEPSGLLHEEFTGHGPETPEPSYNLEDLDEDLFKSPIAETHGPLVPANGPVADVATGEQVHQSMVDVDETSFSSSLSEDLEEIDFNNEEFDDLDPTDLALIESIKPLDKSSLQYGSPKSGKRSRVDDDDNLESRIPEMKRRRSE